MERRTPDSQRGVRTPGRMRAAGDSSGAVAAHRPRGERTAAVPGYKVKLNVKPDSRPPDQKNSPGKELALASGPGVVRAQTIP